ncbi:MAG: flippase-like domain-containing protein [Dehalococcoidia bacterium]|nr:flippase-like domain-containing protein [Dehalococcoidia bacterium]
MPLRKAPAAARPGGEPGKRLGNRLLLSLALTSTLLLVFALRLDLDNLLDELAGTNFAWVGAAVVMNLAAQYFRALRHHYLLLPARDLPTSGLTGAVIIGAAINNVLPLRGGSVARMQLIAKRFDVSRPTVAATMAAEIVLDTLIVSAFLVVGIFALHLGSLLGWIASAVLAASASLLVLAWLLSRSFRHGDAFAEQRLRFLPETTRKAVGQGLMQFELGWQAVWRARQAAPLVAASAAIWLSESVSYWFFGLAVDLDLSPLAYLTLVALANIVTSLAFTPAGLGAFELSVSELLRRLDVSSGAAGAYVLLSHGVLTLMMMAVAPVAFYLLRVRASDLLYLRRPPEDEPPLGAGRA